MVGVVGDDVEPGVESEEGAGVVGRWWGGGVDHPEEGVEERAGFVLAAGAAVAFVDGGGVAAVAEHDKAGTDLDPVGGLGGGPRHRGAPGGHPRFEHESEPVDGAVDPVPFEHGAGVPVELGRLGDRDRDPAGGGGDGEVSEDSGAVPAVVVEEGEDVAGDDLRINNRARLHKRKV